MPDLKDLSASLRIAAFAVPAGHLVFSIVGFAAIYALLFALWVYILRGLLRRGPASEPRQPEVAA